MPIPIAAPPLASNIALLFTARTLLHANSRSAITSADTAFPETCFQLDARSPGANEFEGEVF